MLSGAGLSRSKTNAGLFGFPLKGTNFDAKDQATTFVNNPDYSTPKFAIKNPAASNNQQVQLWNMYLMIYFVKLKSAIIILIEQPLVWVNIHVVQRPKNIGTRPFYWVGVLLWYGNGFPKS